MGLFEKKSTFRKFIDSITNAIYDNPDLGPEFMEELTTRGRIYAYRYRPEGRIYGKPIDEYKGK